MTSRKLMYIYNTTFFIDPSSERRFLAWIRPLIETELCSVAGENPRLSRLLEIPGECGGEEQPLSIAFQVEFDSREVALRWGEEVMEPQLKEFRRRFMPAAMSFRSLFETLPV